MTTPSSQRPQVIYVKQKNNGCVFWAVAVLLFGWVGVLWFAAWKLVKLAWNLNAWGWRVIWRGTVALWNAGVRGGRALTPYAVRGVQTFHARYGWRGWAVVGVVVVVLAIIGALTSH